MHSNIYNKCGDESSSKLVVVRCEPQPEDEGKILEIFMLFRTISNIGIRYHSMKRRKF
jgi:hypothetical protein